MITTIKKIRTKLSTGIMYYLISSINVYFMCELLKTSKIIKIDPYHFKDCLYDFNNYCSFYLSNDKINTVCGILNYKENYSGFIKNLVYMLLVINILLYDISFDSFNFKYWVVVHVTVIVYSLLDYISIFEFSLESTNSYSLIQILIISIIGFFLLILIVRQIRKNGLKYSFLMSMFMFYLFIFTLLKSITPDVKLHFHHSFCAGFLSIFFTDFDSTLNLYMHAIMIGIVIQGINVFTIAEILPFNISYTPSPQLEYMMWLYFIYFIGWIILIFDAPMICNICSNIKKKCCLCKENTQLDILEVPLLNYDDSFKCEFN